MAIPEVRKFNDEARARLVLRWEQLERESRLKENGQRSEQKLLVTEAEIMHKSDEIRRDMIAGENAESDGCMTTSQIAQMLGTTTKALNKLLVDMGIQFWNGGRYKLTKGHQNSGYAKDRMFHYYALDGEKKQRAYLVWTPVGMEMIRAII